MKYKTKSSNSAPLTSKQKSLAAKTTSTITDSIGKRVTVAMITKNEERSVEIVIRHIQTHIPEAEILLVDSSEDNTPRLAEALGARVIRQFPPRGYGPAMERALRESSREVIVTMDCDNTYPAEQISTLARLILEEGYDLVDGSRLEKKPLAMPWMNYLANVIFAKLASVLFWRRLTDLHSGMRAYRKTMLNDLTLHANGAALPVELLLKPITLGYKIHTVFIPYHDRIGQSTLQPLDSAWWTLKRIFNIRFY